MLNKSKGWIGAGMLAGVLFFGGNRVLANSKQNLEKIANQVSVVQISEKDDLVKDPNSIGYKTINEIVVKDFLDGYLKEITLKSNNFKKLRKKHGEDGLLERYCSAHELTLKLAFEYKNKKIPNEAYILLGKELSKKQDETAKGISRIEYLDENVSMAFANWGKWKTENFKRLLNASEKLKAGELKTEKQKESYIEKLHRLAYTREGYVQYLEGQNKANDELYAAMKSTLNDFEKWVGGKQIKTINKTGNKFYMETLTKYFGKKK